jgi:hypothetical protein
LNLWVIKPWKGLAFPLENNGMDIGKSTLLHKQGFWQHANWDEEKT